MNVVGEQDDGLCRPRVPLTGNVDSVAKQLAGGCLDKRWPPPVSDQGEEEQIPIPISEIVGHGRIVMQYESVGNKLPTLH